LEPVAGAVWVGAVVAEAPVAVVGAGAAPVARSGAPAGTVTRCCGVATWTCPIGWATFGLNLVGAMAAAALLGAGGGTATGSPAAAFTAAWV